jgi:hypothetical protein
MLSTNYHVIRVLGEPDALLLRGIFQQTHRRGYQVEMEQVVAC